MPCSGDELEVCGSSYRMNAYGPIFRSIEPNQVVYEHEVLHQYFELNIDLKLEENTLDTEANIFGQMVQDETYPNVGSQIPAAFLKPNSMVIEVCMQVNNGNLCRPLFDAIEAGVWFNLYIEQWCYTPNDTVCVLYVFKDNQTQFFWNNYSPTTFYYVQGIIGNTYGGKFAAASGQYKNFQLKYYETRDSPSDKIDMDAIDLTEAANFVAE